MQYIEYGPGVITIMDFDKDEDSLDSKYNLYKLKIQQIKWNKEEIKLNTATLAHWKKRIDELEIQIFFAIIDRYVMNLEFEVLDYTLEKEFKVLNS